MNNPYDNMDQNQHQTINITNQIHKHYLNGAHNQKEREDDGPTAADLNAQILMELQQANSLAKNTHKNVKKIAASAKPSTYVTNEELDRLEEEVSNRGGGGGHTSTMPRGIKSGLDGGNDNNRHFLSPETVPQMLHLSVDNRNHGDKPGSAISNRSARRHGSNTRSPSKLSHRGDGHSAA